MTDTGGAPLWVPLRHLLIFSRAFPAEQKGVRQSGEGQCRWRVKDLCGVEQRGLRRLHRLTDGEDDRTRRLERSGEPPRPDLLQFGSFSASW